MFQGIPSMMVARGTPPVGAGGGITWSERASSNFFPCTSGQGHSGENITTAITPLGTWVSSPATGLFNCQGDAGGTVGPNTNNSDKLRATYYNNSYSFLGVQYSQETLTAVPDDAHACSAGVAVRIQTSGENCYFLEYSNQAGTKNAILGKINAGTVTAVVTTAVTYTNGVKLRLEVVGSGSSTLLTGYADTGSGYVAISGMTSIDPGGTYIDGGKPGPWARGSNQSAALDDWSGGDGA